MFFGFNFTFFPMFVMGYLGMPRRYQIYPPEFQLWHVLASAGAVILAIAYLLPMGYLAWSLVGGDGRRPSWGATGLEWQTTSPPPKENFPPPAGDRRGPLRLPPRGFRAARGGSHPLGTDPAMRPGS